MPRTARVELAGGIHHVTARGNRQQAIFRDDRDRHSFLRELAVVTDRHRWIPLAYCLMSNHVHLVIETPLATLGAGMHQLAGRHAQRFNRRHGTSGHLFQGRYHSVLVRSGSHLAQLLRYVALNPVAAGLCRDPEQWPWSSHRKLLGGTGAALDRVDALLEEWGGDPGSRYGRLFAPDHPLADDFPVSTARRPSLKEMLGRGDLDRAMRSANQHGYSFTEIAAEVGLHPTTVLRRVRRAGAG